MIGVGVGGLEVVQMKGGAGGGGVGANAAVSTKRRWRGFVIAVLGLVILSMLVPLVFLLGFHNAFHNYSSSSGSGSGIFFSPFGFCFSFSFSFVSESNTIQSNLISCRSPGFPSQQQASSDSQVTTLSFLLSSFLMLLLVHIHSHY